MKIFGFNLDRLFVLLIAVCILLLTGCDGFKVSQGVHAGVASGIVLAQDELPGLEATNIVSAIEATVITGYLNLATTLNAQFDSCYTNANQTAVKSNAKFLACLNIFSVGLNDPKELAQLRILNPKASAKVQLWSGFIVGSINLAITQLGGMVTPAPVIAPTSPTSAELNDFAKRAGVAYGR